MARKQPYFYKSQLVHYVRGTVTFADDGTAVEIGRIPNGSILLTDELPNGAYTSVAFDAGTTNTLDIGFGAHKTAAGADVAADPNGFATLLAVGAVGWDPCDETASERLVDADADGLPITATVVLTGTAATAGSAEVVIAYIAPLGA